MNRLGGENERKTRYNPTWLAVHDEEHNHKQILRGELASTAAYKLSLSGLKKSLHKIVPETNLRR